MTSNPSEIKNQTRRHRARPMESLWFCLRKSSQRIPLRPLESGIVAWSDGCHAHPVQPNKGGCGRSEGQNDALHVHLVVPTTIRCINLGDWLDIYSRLT